MADTADAFVTSVEHGPQAGTVRFYNTGTGHGSSMRVAAAERATGPPVPWTATCSNVPGSGHQRSVAAVRAATRPPHPLQATPTPANCLVSRLPQLPTGRARGTGVASGNEADNQALGQRRADAVRDYLQQLVTDEQTRQQIRAYSLGAPSDGPTGDVPSLRKVEVQITRRTYHIDLGAMHPTPTLPGGGTPDLSLPEILRLPNPPIPQPGEVHLPDWFWRELPPLPPQPSLISQVSRWLNQTLHTHDIAGVAADVASAFGLDRARVQRMLDDAFQSGGEAALKALLRQAIEGAAGHPTSPPSSPTGPPVEPRPFPTPQAQTPNIPTP